MVVPKHPLLHEERFRSKLAVALSKALPIALASGALLLSSCQPVGNHGGGTSCYQQRPTCQEPPKGATPEGDEQLLYTLEFTMKEPPTQKECVVLCRREFEKNCPVHAVGNQPSHAFECQDKGIDEQSGLRTVDCRVSQRVCVSAGRRPDGLAGQLEVERPRELTATQEAGFFFAELAYLETAAVTAFEHLTRELEAYDAPAELIEVSRQAIHEEVEHAELMTLLAHRYGVTEIPEVQVAPFRLRPLHEIAYDNAREGCTRETFGALMGMWQASTAEDDAVRAVMERIAYEESRHAALSWAIDAWIRPQLTSAQQAQSEQIQEESVALLREETRQPVSQALIRHAGYPPPEASQVLLENAFFSA